MNHAIAYGCRGGKTKLMKLWVRVMREAGNKVTVVKNGRVRTLPPLKPKTC